MDIQSLSVEEIFAQVERIIQEKPETVSNLAGAFAFDIKGDEAKQYTVAVRNGAATVSNQIDSNADCTLSMNEKNFKKLIDGSLNAPAAFMTGKLKVKGNIGLALKLESALKQFSW